MKFRKKPVVIESITFDELVEHGKAQGVPTYNGMPWSFDYKGHPITHEDDNTYLIPTLEGTHKMTCQDRLITGVKGEIYPCKLDIFDQTYEPAESQPTPDQVREIVAKWLYDNRRTESFEKFAYESGDRGHADSLLAALRAAGVNV